jgi:hypothetical protein
MTRSRPVLRCSDRGTRSRAPAGTHGCQHALLATRCTREVVVHHRHSCSSKMAETALARGGGWTHGRRLHRAPCTRDLRVRGLCGAGRRQRAARRPGGGEDPWRPLRVRTSGVPIPCGGLWSSSGTTALDVRRGNSTASVCRAREPGAWTYGRSRPMAARRYDDLGRMGADARRAPWAAPRNGRWLPFGAGALCVG